MKISPCSRHARLNKRSLTPYSVLAERYLCIMILCVQVLRTCNFSQETSMHLYESSWALCRLVVPCTTQPWTADFLTLVGPNPVEAMLEHGHFMGIYIRYGTSGATYSHAYRVCTSAMAHWGLHTAMVTRCRGCGLFK